MPRYLKGKHIVKHHNDLYNSPSSNKNGNLVKLNGKPTFVTTLASRLTDKEKYMMSQRNFSVKDYRFATSPNLDIYNLSKLGFEPEINFVFNDEEYQEMLSTPKVVVSESCFRYLESSGELYLIHRYYLLAPNLNDKELPSVYRMSIQFKPNRKTYAVTLQAVVGGCRDGSLNLMRIDSPHSVGSGVDKHYIDQPHIHKAVPMRANDARIECLPKTLLEGQIDNMTDALAKLMELGAIKYQAECTASSKIADLINIYSRDTAHKIAKPISAESIIEGMDYITPEKMQLRERERPNSSTIGDIEWN